MFVLDMSVGWERYNRPGQLLNSKHFTIVFKMPSDLLNTERSSLSSVPRNLPQQLFRHGRCNIFNNYLQIFKGARLHFFHIYRYLIPDLVSKMASDDQCFLKLSDLQISA